MFRSGGGRPQPDPASAAHCEELIDSLNLAAAETWSGQALLAALRSLASYADSSVQVVSASLRGDESFDVTYRRLERGNYTDRILGTVGERDAAATLLLMPHVEPDDVPLDPQTYGAFFSIVGVQEPFGPEEYGQPDENGVCWFDPPDFRVS